ncbi:MAG: hypothetical protein AB8V16_03270 [Coxiella endosymbiont of Dermacentor nuttalli]
MNWNLWKNLFELRLIPAFHLMIFSCLKGYGIKALFRFSMDVSGAM